MAKKSVLIGSATSVILTALFFQNCGKLETLQKMEFNSTLSTDNNNSSPSRENDSGNITPSGITFNFDQKAKKLVFCHFEGAIATTSIYNLQSQTFETAPGIIGHCNQLVTGNFNGDATEDFANSNNNNQGECKLSIYSGETSALISEKLISGSSSQTSNYCTASISTVKDKNNDNRDDFLLNFSVSSNMFIGHLLSSNGQEVNMQQLMAPHIPLLAADINGDNKEDIFTGYTYSSGPEGTFSRLEVFSGQNMGALQSLYSKNIARANEFVDSIMEVKRKNQRAYYVVDTRYQPDTSQPATASKIILLNDQFVEVGSREFPVAQDSNLSYYAEPVETADVNGDGIQEIIIINRTGRFAVEYIIYDLNLTELYRVTSARLSTAAGVSVSTNFTVLGSANLNADAKGDLVLNTWEWVNGAWQLRVYFYDVMTNSIISKFTPDTYFQTNSAWYSKVKPLR